MVPKRRSMTAPLPNDAPSRRYPLIKGGKARSAAFWSMASFGRRFIDVPCCGQRRLPIPRRASEMVKKAQGKRKRAGIGALKAGAADHDVDPVMQDIRPIPAHSSSTVRLLR